MPFLHDDSLLLAVYQAQQMVEKSKLENNGDKERLKRIINYKQIKQSKSNADTYAIIIGFMFVASVVLFAFYAGSQIDEIPSNIRIFSVRDSEGGDTFQQNNNVKPLHYVLYLNLDAEKKLYTGLVKIKFYCTEKSSDIILNSARNINITKIALKTFNTTDIDDYKVKQKSHYMNGDKVVLRLNKELVRTDEYEMYIGFHSNLTQFTENGLYYIEQPSTMIIGTLEKNRSPKVFPCFSSNSEKAQFQLILQHHYSLNAASNMPLREKIALDRSDRVESYFEETPLFSSSMLTFVLSKLTIVKTVDLNHIKVNIYSTPAREQETITAHEIVGPLFKFFQNIFGTVPVKKIDFVPMYHLEEDVIGSYGIVLLKEEHLLFDESKGSPYQLERVAKAVAQGVNSQWFLDFASTEECYSIVKAIKILLSYPAVQEIYPSWEIENTFFVDNMNKVMKDDSFNEGKFLFKIEKTTAIVRMMTKYIGKEKFFKAVKDFLDVNKEDTDSEYCDELTTILTKISNEFDFMEFLNTWQQQNGFPLVSAHEINRQFKLKQKQFLFRSEEANTDTQMLFWRLPIQFSCNGTRSKNELITLVDRFGITSSCIGGDLYIINDNGVGYYHTDYEDGNWNKILNKLNKNMSSFTVAQRTIFLNDMFALIYSGKYPITNALEFTNYLEKENNDVPFYKAIHELHHLQHLFNGDSKLKTYLQGYLYKKAQQIFKKLYKSKNLAHIQKKLLSIAAHIVVTSRSVVDKLLLMKFENLFLEWLISNERSSIQGWLRNSIVTVGIQSNNHYAWEKLLEYYRSTSSQEERNLVLFGLAQTSDEDLLFRYLTLLNSSDTFYQFDKMKAYSHLCLNEKANPNVRSELLKHLPSFYSRQRTEVDVFHTLISNCYGCLHSNEDITELSKLQSSVKEYKEMASMLERMKSVVKLNIRITTYKDDLINWFENNQRSSNDFYVKYRL